LTLSTGASAVAAWLLPDESGSNLVALDQHGDFIAQTLLWIGWQNSLPEVKRQGNRLKVMGGFL
jgi:hypothetical protein